MKTDSTNKNMEILEKAFGQSLQQVRKEKKMSQEELGMKSGFHRTYISLLERGQKSPSLRTLFGLAAALEVEPVHFVQLLQTRMKMINDSLREN